MLTRHSLTFFHCSHNGSKVVVKENHVRDLLGYLSPSNAHRHTWKWRGGRGEGEVGGGSGRGKWGMGEVLNTFLIPKSYTPYALSNHTAKW